MTKKPWKIEFRYRPTKEANPVFFHTEWKTWRRYQKEASAKRAFETLSHKKNFLAAQVEFRLTGPGGTEETTG